jgi:hypothetical protein
MSLNFDLTRCDPAACFKGEGDDRTLTTFAEGMIWSTMAIDIGDLNAKNLDEVVWRLNFLISIDRAVLRKDHDGSFYTRDEIRPFVGLRTNVSTKTRKAWLRSVFDSIERNFNYSQQARFREEAGVLPVTA